MNENADIVIIGGGIIGIAIAYELAKRKSSQKIIVLEKENLLGLGSTGKCAGGVRLQFATEVNIKLSLESMKVFENFSKEMDYPTEFYQNGYLFLLSKERDYEEFKKIAILQNRMGVDSRIITPKEAQAILPQIQIDDLKGASFCARDGFISPADVVAGYEKQARRLGVNIKLNAEVTGINIEKDNTKTIHTKNGSFSAPVVVNAAGPYAALIGKMVGIEIPVEPVRRHIFVTAPFHEIKDPFPLTVDFATHLYFHRESNGILLGRSREDEPIGFNTSVDWEYLPQVIEAALHRVPILEKANIATGWAGLYEVTPDAHPILGEVQSIKGFYCANGLSGHGFMHAPAVGKLIAELILTNHTNIDISSLSLARFSESKYIEEHAVI